MSWAVFIDHQDGKAKVDLYCFARISRIVSEHASRGTAEAALVEYRRREKHEAALVAGQQELPL